MYTERTLFDGDDNSGDDAASEWNYLTISGWHRVGGINSAYDNMTRAIYDDIYIATGANAAARAEIGDDSVYADCTKLAIATPTGWSDTEIVATMRGGEFAPGDTAYVFVIDADNVPSTGYQITIPVTRQRHRYGSSIVSHEEE